MQHIGSLHSGSQHAGDGGEEIVLFGRVTPWTVPDLEVAGGRPNPEAKSPKMFVVKEWEQVLTEQSEPEQW